MCMRIMVQGRVAALLLKSRNCKLLLEILEDMGTGNKKIKEGYDFETDVPVVHSLQFTLLKCRK